MKTEKLSNLKSNVDRMIELNTVNVMGFNVFNDELSKISFTGKTHISMISPNSYNLSTTNPTTK